MPRVGTITPVGKGITADEVELASFKERERRDNVKKELAVFRKQESNALIIGKPMESGNNVLGTKTVFGQKNTILKTDREPTRKKKNNNLLKIGKGKSLLG